jgi:hypothetical protein
LRLEPLPKPPPLVDPGGFCGVGGVFISTAVFLGGGAGLLSVVVQKPAAPQVVPVGQQ